eukprot:10105592-Alexandrium_andersonii.AAC.1
MGTKEQWYELLDARYEECERTYLRFEDFPILSKESQLNVQQRLFHQWDNSPESRNFRRMAD